MKSLPRLITLALLAIGAASHAAALDNEAAAHLRLLQEVPDVAGHLIYRGSVAAPAARAGAPLFSYERRVADAGAGLSAASHITRDAGGQVLISESAQFDAAYSLRRFDAVNRQQGYSGSAVLSADGHELQYRVQIDGRLRTANERTGAALVSGPSLHGFILRHWDRLAAGDELPVRMIVLKEMTTYGFQIRRSSVSAGQTSFSITPSSWLVRLAVAPLSVTFDNQSRHVVRYEGRVPPMLERNGKLAALDARVDYEALAQHYR